VVKNKKVLYRTKALLLVVLAILIGACNRQDSRTSGSRLIQTQNQTADSSFEKDPLSEPISQVVRDMLEDRNGNTWFGTQNGAFLLVNDSLVQLDQIKSESGQEVTIHDMAEGVDGKIWFAHTDGLSSYDGQKVRNYYESDGLIHHDVWSVEVDRKGIVWVGTYGGVCKFKGQTFTEFELPEGIRDITRGVSSKKMVHHIMEDHKGNIWFCTNAGLFRLNGDSLHHSFIELGLQTKFVNRIIESEKGGYWISTKEGLYYLDENKLKNISESIPELGKGIGAIAEDKKGHVYFVLNQHELNIYDGEKIKAFDKPEKNQGPVVYQIYKDKDDRLWLLGFGGAYRLEDGQFVEVTKSGPW
jgi:ligand-binding sensor domain-containing protein